jgi:hypothetical protein
MSTPRSLVEATLDRVREMHATALNECQEAKADLHAATERDQTARNRAHRFTCLVSALEELLREDGPFIDPVPY